MAADLGGAEVDQPVPFVGGPTEPPGVDGVGGEAAPLQVFPRPGAALGVVLETTAEIGVGDLVGPVQRFFGVRAGGGAGGGAAFVFQGDARPLRQLRHRLHELAALHLLDELDDPARLAAAEAFEDLQLGIEVEGWGLLFVEGAEGGKIAADAAELQPVAFGDGDDVGRVLDAAQAVFFDEGHDGCRGPGLGAGKQKSPARAPGTGKRGSDPPGLSARAGRKCGDADGSWSRAAC